MSFLSRLFNKKTNSTISYEEFWDWFQMHERSFYYVVKNKADVEQDFFNKLSPKLNLVKNEMYFQTGMCNDDTVELVITAEGSIKNIVFAEELIQAAPNIDGWKFTALKQSLDIKNIHIEMAGYSFNSRNLNFYANHDAEYPDDINISVTHTEATETNKGDITNGVYIYLDHLLGELNFVNTIDYLEIVPTTNSHHELIPIEKLLAYLTWREKEFVEKYEGTSHDTTNDEHAVFEADLPNGNSLVATMNTDLLKWDKKVSHPWMVTVEIVYDGSKHKGMPNPTTYEQLNEIEESLIGELQSLDGYLNIGRQTANGMREIYFACQEFRKPSKVRHLAQSKYAKQFSISYEIHKDKYWRSLNRFRTS